MIYQGTNWPKSYRDKAYTFNFHGRRMNCDRLVRDGNGYTGKHEPDLFRTEDEWFRGVELQSGPDGAVYALDWSDLGECHENDGVHRSSGRIYKLFHRTGFEPSEFVNLDLSKLSNAELVRLQSHDNVWHERTARRVLMERAVAGQDMSKTVQSLLTLGGERTPEQELRVMWTAYCLGHQDEGWLLDYLNHPDEHVQSWAVRLLCDRHGELSERTIKAFKYRAEFAKSGLLRLYLASAMQRMPLEDRFDVAIDLSHYEQDTTDRMQPLMIWYGIEPAVAQFPKKAMALATSSRIPLLRRFIARRIAAEYSKPNALTPLISTLRKSDAQQQVDLLSGMSDALKGVRKATAPAGWKEYAANASQNARTADAVRELGVVFGDGRALADVRKIATNRQAADDARIEAIRVLAGARPDGLFETLKPLVNDRVAAGAAVRAMAASNHNGVAGAVLRAYTRLPAEDKAAAIDTLVARANSSHALLDAVSDGRVDKSVITAFHARQIRSFGNETLNQKLTKVWGAVRESSADRRAMMQKIASLVANADQAPDIKAGHALFRKHCASCHVMFGEGGNIGPDLTGSNRKNLQYLLENIIDPSASVATGFRSSVVQLEDGRTLNGVVVEENDTSLTLQTAKERVRIAKADLEERKQTQQSLMPDGLFKDLGDQQIIDLISFLQSR